MIRKEKYTITFCSGKLLKIASPVCDTADLHVSTLQSRRDENTARWRERDVGFREPIQADMHE